MVLRAHHIGAAAGIVTTLFLLLGAFKNRDTVTSFAYGTYSSLSSKGNASEPSILVPADSPATHPAIKNNLFDLPEADLNFTKAIWQTAKYAAQNQSKEESRLAATWADLNPSYRHEMITHERMLGYCEDHFRYTHPELEQLYLETTDYMLRTDIIRYLILLQHGGVYSDLDVECLVPIDSWLRQEYPQWADHPDVGVILSPEADYDKGPDEGGYYWQLVVWTMMAKPNQPFVRFVLSRLMQRMADVSASAQQALTQMEVLELTGPAATTTDFFAYASEITGTEVTYANYTKITEPVLVGEVLLLPIWAFGAQHQVANSGIDQGNGKMLVRHWFKNSWKADHKDE